MKLHDFLNEKSKKSKNKGFDENDDQTIYWKIIDKDTGEELAGKTIFYHNGWEESMYRVPETGQYQEGVPGLDSEKILDFLKDDFDDKVWNEDGEERVYYV